MAPPLAPLAEAAQVRHLAAPGGSLARKGAGCALVVLREARTVKGALRMLATSTLPDAIRNAAADLIHELSAQQAERPDPKETTCPAPKTASDR